MDLSPFECFNYIQQEYLICITVHKAKNLCIFNADTYVKVIVDKKHKSTSVYKNSENPFFNEYFVFELFCSLPELLRLTVLFEVRKKSCCVDTNIGELFIDLATVWNQSGHQFYKKWGKLENPIGKVSNKPRGHLQIDLAVISKTESPTPAIAEPRDYDDIESNLLLSEDDASHPCNVRYQITIYSAVFTKKSDYLVQISFAGMNAKTRTIKLSQHPEWNEQIKINWYYPSLAKKFLIQIMYREYLQWKCISDYEIHFDEITFPGCLPSLGPTYIHFYDSLDPHNYVGKILMQIKSENIGTLVPSARRDVNKSSVPPLNEHVFWNDENFIIEALIWQGDFIHNNASNMKFSIHCGVWKSSIAEFYLHNYELSTLKYFEQEQPHKSVLLNAYFPNCHEKIYPDIFLHELIFKMQKQLNIFKMFQLRNSDNVRSQAKCLKSLIKSFSDMIHDAITVAEYLGNKKLTEWDKNLRKYLKEFLENILKDFKEYKKSLKMKFKNPEDNIEIAYRNLMIKIKDIENILSLRIQDNWPDLILYLSISGNAVAYCKLDPKIYLYSKFPELCGRLCGKRHSLVFKPLTCLHTCKCCGCIYGKIDGWIWIGTAMERSAYTILNGWKQHEHRFYDYETETNFNCNVYIHQAKIRPGSDVTGLCDPRIRVTFLNCQQETSLLYETLSPIWNEVITIKNLRLPGTVQYYVENPPMIALELYDIDSKTSSDYLGCTLIRLAVQPLQNQRKSPLKVLYERNTDEENFQLELSQIKENEENHESIIKSSESDEENENQPQQLIRKDKKDRTIPELTNFSNKFPPALQWSSIWNDGVALAEVLVSADLVEIVPENTSNLIDIDLYQNIPKEILPIMEKYKVEITFIGLRNWHKMFVLCEGKYTMKCLFGDLCLYSGPSTTRMNESLNFLDSYVTGICSLPKQLEYWPPLIFAHINSSKKNHEVTIGAALISASYKYLQIEQDHKKSKISRSRVIIISEELRKDISEERIPLISDTKKKFSGIEIFSKIKKFSNKLSDFINYKLINTKVEILKKQIQKPIASITITNFDVDDYNWWTKFYNSLKVDDDESHKKSSNIKLKHKLIIYGNELEKQPEFDYFQDWAESVHMIRGMKKRKNLPLQEESYCTLKCNIKLKSCELDASSKDNSLNLKTLNTIYENLNYLINETRIFVRVYIVRGINLRTHDAHSQADPYLKLQFGSQKFNDRANYQQNQANPIFGKRVEFEGVIPREHILHVAVYDHGCIDDLIGCTCIDLEDRLRTKHRAGIGIAKEFSTHGYNAWRDYSSPKEILQEICLKNGLKPPKIRGKKIEVDGVLFEDSTEISKDENLHERLCLSVLKRMDDVPSLRYKLVPEHVETRSLFRNDRPGVEQGKIQMWVEIYEYDKVPYPIDITPTPIKNYELRVIVWNTSDVILQEQNIFGKKMSDIYVKGWLEESTLAQYTDIHYRSLTGVGNFNWRMIFPFKYSFPEEMMIITKKGDIFEKFDDIIKLPPVLYIQIWDNDTVSADDFLGSLEIDLTNFPEPTKTAKLCSLGTMNKKNTKHINLFLKKRIKGWFPATGKLDDDTIGLTGKVELEIELVTENEAEADPVGLGREGPNPLPFPKRPKSSFAWFSNPLQAFKQILLPAIKKILIAILIVMLLIGIVYGIIKSIPGQIVSGVSPF